MSGKMIAITIITLTALLVGAWLLENHAGEIRGWFGSLQISSAEGNRSPIRVGDDRDVVGDDIREITVHSNYWSPKVIIPPYHYAHIIPPRNGWVGLLPEGSNEEIAWQYGETPYLGNISAFQLRGTDGGIARIWTQPR